jgi:hypothetical protein
MKTCMLLLIGSTMWMGCNGDRATVIGVAPPDMVPANLAAADDCPPPARLIYAVDRLNMPDVPDRLIAFDPEALVFSDLGAINCGQYSPTGGMAVDRHATTAWLIGTFYVLKLDLATMKCSKVYDLPDKWQDVQLGFAADGPSSHHETLYAAARPYDTLVNPQLLAFSLADFSASPRGTIVSGMPSLTGDGAGRLWAYFHPDAFGQAPRVVEIDPLIGNELQWISLSYPNVGLDLGGSFVFWGGDFWIFYSTSVYRLGLDGTTIEPITNSGHNFEFAASTTCAPLKRPQLGSN